MGEVLSGEDEIALTFDGVFNGRLVFTHKEHQIGIDQDSFNEKKWDIFSYMEKLWDRECKCEEKFIEAPMLNYCKECKDLFVKMNKLIYVS